MATDKATTAPTLWLYHAVQDYASARCLLLNELSGGFVLAQQAIEKLLKAYLTVAYPDQLPFIGRKGLREKVLPVTASHDLIAHQRLAEESFPFLAIGSAETELLTNLSFCFQGKYPDEKTPLKYTTTAWLEELDDLFVTWSLGLPVPDEDRWKTGIYVCVWSDVIGDQANPPYLRWIREHNQAFAKVFHKLCEVVAEGNEASNQKHKANL
jgi:hypothetical protein